MPWLAVVLLGHLMNAGAFVVDKMLLRATVRQPAVYVFFIGILNLVALVLVPWSTLTTPPTYVIVQGAISGGMFVLGLLGFFTALQRAEATRVVPMFGALVSVWTILFASILLGERLVGREVVGVAALIAGAILISYESGNATRQLNMRTILEVLGAAAAFALSATMLKAVFNSLGFLDGFLLTRAFNFAAVLPLLAWPVVRRTILSHEHFGGGVIRPLFLVGQVCGASGFMLLAWATELAEHISIVNALQGVQYAFLFVLIYFLSRLKPRLLKEHWPRRLVVQKVSAIVILSIGLGLVA